MRASHALGVAGVPLHHTCMAVSKNACGAPTRSGGSCGWERALCPHHGRKNGPANAPAANPVVPAARTNPARPGASPAEERDLRKLGWWVIERVISGELTSSDASVVSSVMRVLAALGPATADSEDALREVQLRGRLMHGRPPKDAEEWALAGRLFTDDALAEFRRWEQLWREADADDGVQPLFLWDRAPVEGDEALVIDAEDGS
jgi:hypothetical protein